MIYASPDLSEDDRRDLEWAEREFGVCLNEPAVLSLTEKNPQDWYCFFTPEGMERFKDCLDVMWNLFYALEEAGLGEVIELEVDSFFVEVVWQDEYQAVVSIPPHVIGSLRKERRERIYEADYNDVDNKLLAGTESAM